MALPVSSAPSIGGRTAGITHQPETLQEAASLMAECQRLGQSVAITGGGTALGLGNPPRALDVRLDTRRLCRVEHYAPEDQVIVAQAGMTLAQLQTLVGDSGQWLGCDAPHPERATVGGLVATAAFGPRRVRYGALRDLLIGVTLVRADGVIARAGGRVVKNVAGFDLAKVLCGSLGTLGLIAEVTFRLHPLPQASGTLTLEKLSEEAVLTVSRRLRQAQLEPSSVVALQQVNGGFELGIRFEGFDTGVTRDVELCATLAAEITHQTPERQDNATRFWRAHDAARDVRPLRVRATALPSAYPAVQAALAPLVNSIEAPRGVWYPTLGISFVGGAVVDVEPILLALQHARDRLVAQGGSLVVECAPDAVASAFDAWGPVGGALEVMTQLKRRFDPGQRLNPGRFVGGI